jgi:aryl-alcohol dehydrogenase-like predicted oxidoreductase
VSAEYAESDRNWATIEIVNQIAKESGVTPAQVALSRLANRPGVTAPIFGARTLEQLNDGLGAADLTLGEEATASLAAVSAPKPGGYPYGAFGTGQRYRWMQDGTPAPKNFVAEGSAHPLG